MLLIGIGLVIAVALAAVGVAASDSGGAGATTATPAPGCEESRSTAVAQPSRAQLQAAGLDELPLASEGDRVDRLAPPFSAPTEITNPLFPIRDLHSAILNGRVDGQRFKVETTLLPQTRIMEWTDGQCVETLVSQYVAYLDGELFEVALDLYAQADDGSVWYLGEDVFNYADGNVADLHGTWHAGKEGPAAMIMPGRPAVGDVYRPENIPGLVFEEVTVKEIGKTVDGPRGRVSGAIVITELHADGAFEEKVFAPGYGEFFTGSGGDVEAIALAVPTDALGGPVPPPLRRLASGADETFDAVRDRDWRRAANLVDSMDAAWSSYRGDAPPRLRAVTSAALEALAEAVDDRERAGAAQAALDVADASLDLELQYRPVAAIDLGRFDVWLRRLIGDAQAKAAPAVRGDLATLEWIRDRFVGSLGKLDVTRIDTHLEELRTTVDERDFAGASETASSLREVLERL